MNFSSKLPQVGTTIFSVMSTLAREHQAINLSQGFPEYSSEKKLIDLVEQYMRKGYNQYAPMGGVPELKEQLALKLQQLYGIQVNPDQEITITAGATQAIFTVITTFVQPGDEVILIEPAYDAYRPAIELVGGIPKVYELQAPDYRVDWEQFKRLVSARTKMVIINTPHNPTGTILRAADLRQLAHLLKDTDIFLLSDEVYEHLIFDHAEHETALKYPELRERCFATYSFGKTFHNTGWKVGYCVAPLQLTKEFRKVHQYNTFSVNTPVQYALAEYLKDPDTYQQLSAFYQRKRDFFNAIIDQEKLRPLNCEGTYFQLYDYSAVSDESDVDFATRLTTEHGVAVIPVSGFYSSKRDDRVIRLCFAKQETTLAKAGELLRHI